MALPDIFHGLPEVSFKGSEGARWIWEERRAPDVQFGMISWKGKRCWIRFSSYDQDEGAVRYAVFALTDEEARVLDDWHALYCFLGIQAGLLAIGSYARKEKITQMEALAATLPKVESAPLVAHFAVRDDGSD